MYIFPSMSWLPPLPSNFSGQKTNSLGMFWMCTRCILEESLIPGRRPVHLLFHSSNKDHFNASLDFEAGLNAAWITMHQWDIHNILGSLRLVWVQTP